MVESKLASGFNVELCRELDTEPEHFESHLKHPTGVVEVKSTYSNIVDALVGYSQLVEELLLCY